jgi:hypothetical protein
MTSKLEAIAIDAIRQCKISPKVAVPVVGQLVVGVVLWLLGDDVEGRTLVLTALGTLGVGYSSPVGRVIVPSTGGVVTTTSKPVGAKPKA